MPLVGARNRDRLDESLGALDIELRPSDLQQIERSVPPAQVLDTTRTMWPTGQREGRLNDISSAILH